LRQGSEAELCRWQPNPQQRRLPRWLPRSGGREQMERERAWQQRPRLAVPPCSGAWSLPCGKPHAGRAIRPTRSTVTVRPTMTSH